MLPQQILTSSIEDLNVCNYADYKGAVNTPQPGCCSNDVLQYFGTRLH